MERAYFDFHYYMARAMLALLWISILKTTESIAVTEKIADDLQNYIKREFGE